jgi:hypothetical protein
MLPQVSDWKCRLFLVACCYVIWDFLGERSRRAVEIAERWVDGTVGADELEEARGSAQIAAELAEDRLDEAIDKYNRADSLAGREFAPDADYMAQLEDQRAQADRDRSATGVARAAVTERYDPLELLFATEFLDPQFAVTLVRDIFGNPFRPVVFAPEWRTDTAVALARTMYDAREFSAMPILADALQDAGCDNDDILGHCRDTKQVHVRGCWVVDLVLGKA